jgi:hypothetical protein
VPARRNRLLVYFGVGAVAAAIAAVAVFVSQIKPNYPTHEKVVVNILYPPPPPPANSP